AAAASNGDQPEIVRRAERYFEGIETLKSRFVQINPDGNAVEGVIRLQRPGRMRIEYPPEAGLEIIADGRFFILVDHKLENTTYLPLESTPAHLLLREDFKLGRDIEVAGIDRGAGLVRLTLRRAEAPSAGSVTVTLNADPMLLRQWEIEDA
ncbi:MAG: outer membrane lipoprotein carrier protein LolA, partial [Gammaproteobacteria bacterium]|nr:outer membrane lipoprotein carrier protein LolA [Gammaproteobacteria bacterium]